jgi:hypothetical protein
MIDGQDYLSRLTAINMQSDLALRAINGFLDSNEAVEAYLKEELETTRQFTIDAAKSVDFDPKEHWAFSEEGSEKYLSGVKEALPKQLDEVINRIRQNKLLLLVAVFETFMRDIHRGIIRADPTILKADRQIPLGKIIAKPIEELLEDEIEREVQILDRQSIEKKYEYFNKRLNIDWFEGTIIPLMKPVFELRNKISHEDPDIIVTDEDLKMAHLVTYSLPITCAMQAAILYPDSFKYGDSDLDGLKKLMEQQGRIKKT